MSVPIILRLTKAPVMINISRSYSYFHPSRIFNKFNQSQRLHLVNQTRRQFSLESFWTSALQTQAGWFKSLSESTPVEYAHQFFEYIHDTSGLPWWASILVSTVVVRTCITLPLSVYQNYIFAKIENLQQEMPGIVKELKKETVIAIKRFNWTEKQARAAYNRSLKKQWDKLIVRDNCHPFKGSLLIWVQLPMWLCLSVGLRNMASMLPIPDAAAHLLYLQLTLGGLLWIPNLTVPDASLILPVVLAVANLTIIEVQAMARAGKPETKFHKYATHFFRGLSLCMIPIAANVPACMSLYWTASSVCGLSHNLLLMSPRVRRMVGIPLTASEIQRPYQHLLEQIQIRLRIKSVAS